MDKGKIVLTCPNCGNSTWLALKTGDFECLACEDIYGINQMCSEFREFESE